MKKIIGLMILVFWGTSALMSQQYHYYYNGDEMNLDLNTEYAYLILEGVSSPEALQAILGDKAEVSDFDVYIPTANVDAIPGISSTTKGGTRAEITFSTKMRPNAYFKQLENLMKDSHVRYASPYFKNAGDDIVGLTDMFLVKLEEMGDPQALFAFAEQAKVDVIGRNSFMPDWYTLRVTDKSQGNALEMANYFYESGRFAVAEPDFMIDAALCVNDPFFLNQWGFQNTGQWGLPLGSDINACAGWANWGTGNPGIVVAVFDQGIELNHPDLIGQLVANSFDVINGTSPSVVRGNHGTACAGIVAATRNNNLGVVGVAPNVGLMSVSHSLSFSALSSLAAGINWSYQNGADVISNSWGWNASTPLANLDQAIVDALALGRGGLGTVVCFSAGNSNSSTPLYPARSNVDIIVVGALSPCDERKNPSSCDGESWGSDYGATLDVMAPGVKVPTTDRQGTAGYNNSAGTAGDYTQTFNGTSAACPHVAGLAGLILSLNPCLSHQQVAKIIETTAQPVGTYAYASVLGYPHGPWHQEMGYGLIDIDAAMQMTRELYIQNVTITGNETFQVHGKIFAGSNVDPNQISGPVNINAGADVDFLASVSITMEAGFNVNLGAVFTADIISTSCGVWDPNARQAAPGVATVDPQDLEADAVPIALTPAMQASELTIVPNPFNNEVTLNYALDKGSKVQAVLFNSQGQEVLKLISNTEQAAGQYQQKVRLSDQLPAGIYFVRMQVNGQGVTKKLLKQ